MGKRGLLITFEGPEGSGKSTQLNRLATWLRGQGYRVITTREPGGTRIGEAIRALLHDVHFTEMQARAEILLYSASRAQLVDEVIRPALQEGAIILCDRYADSTYAYQGYGRGLPLDWLKAITGFATGGLHPDLTLYLDLPPEVGLERKRAGQEEMNRMDREAMDFHRRVRAGYLEMAAAEPKRWRVIAADDSIEAVQRLIRQQVIPVVKEHLGDLRDEGGRDERERREDGEGGAGGGPLSARMRPHGD